MLINNIPDDMKALTQREGKKYTDIAREMGVQLPHISRLVKNQVVIKGFIAMVEALGYDIKITYVKRADKAKDVLNK